VTDATPSLMLAPSAGFGGGIERVASSVERACSELARVDLYDAAVHVHASGNWRAKADFARHAWRAARHKAPHVVICLHVGLLPVAKLVSHRYRARIFVFVFGRESWRRLGPVSRTVIRNCDGVLAPSQFTLNAFRVQNGVHHPRSVVLPLPIDDTSMRTSDDAGSQKATGGRILSVGRLDPSSRYKGFDDVAAALPLVLERRPDVRWRICGGGTDRERLERRCVELGIGGAVDFLGRVSDASLDDEYRSADVFALPSVADPYSTPPTGEGFGLVYVEAAARGVPSIASTRGGGALEFIHHGRTGLTVPPAEPQSLAGALVKLLDDRSLRNRLVQAARRRALTEHSQDVFAHRLRSALLMSETASATADS
jgi:phosphatidyl-myo-inositol dimannoside synthase